MSTESKVMEYGAPVPPAPAEPAPTAALARVSDAERRVQLAKHRLQQHLALLDQRARSFARQSAWIAGMVLLGIVGVAAAASVFRPKPRRRPARMYYASEALGARPSVGPALMLAAFGLLSRGARSIAAHRARG